MMQFAEYSLFIEGLIAFGTVGTLAATVLTYYRRKKRLIDRLVYTPIRKELMSGLSEYELHRSIGVGAWKKINEEYPYFISAIPSELAADLNQIQSLSELTAQMEYRTRRVVFAELNRAAGDLETHKERGTNGTLRAMLDGSPYIDNIDLLSVWLTGESLSDWVSHYFAKLHVTGNWDLEVLNSGYKVGGKKEALELMDKVSEVLDTNKDAVELRAKSRKIRELSNLALKRVTRKLRSRFAF